MEGSVESSDGDEEERGHHAREGVRVGDRADAEGRRDADLAEEAEELARERDDADGADDAREGAATSGG